MACVLVLALLAGPTTPAGGHPDGLLGGRAHGCRGVEVRPGRNLPSVVERHAAGTTFCLRPGTYLIRSTVTLKAGQRLVGTGRRGTVVITGARIVHATREGDHWVVTGQTTLGQSGFSGTSEQCRPVDGVDPLGMCVYRDQVFLDDQSLWQVPSLAELTRGEFFWDYAANAIHLADDPAGRRLEVSVVGGPAIVGARGIVIDNVVVEKFGNAVQSGAVVAGVG